MRWQWSQGFVEHDEEVETVFDFAYDFGGEKRSLEYQEGVLLPE